MRKTVVFAIIFLFISVEAIPGMYGKIEDLIIPIYGKTIYVDDDFNDDPYNHTWNTIEEGLADAENGDLIRVYNGTYKENLEVNKSVTIQGNNSQDTIIDGNYIRRVINITTYDVKIIGFKIINCGNIGDDNKGIEIWWGKNIIISDNFFSNNNIDLVISYSDGIAGEIIISNNTFSKGRDYNDGLDAYKSNNLIIQNNTFIEKHRGVYQYDADAIILSNNIFENCNTSIFLLESLENRIMYNEISVSNQTGFLGIWLENSNNNKVLYNFINSTINFKILTGILVKRSNSNTIQYNDFNLNLLAMSCINSFFNKICWNNFISSTSGWDLQCTICLNLYWFNYWNQLKGPFGRVLGGCIIFCIPWSPWPWQKIF